MKLIIQKFFYSFIFGLFLGGMILVVGFIKDGLSGIEEVKYASLFMLIIGFGLLFTTEVVG